MIMANTELMTWEQDSLVTPRALTRLNSDIAVYVQYD